METTITLKSNSFKYPTKEERRKIKKLIPEIGRFKVEYKSAITQILTDSSYESAIRSEDIYWWCKCFNNRLAKLTETFVYVQTHYLRRQERGEESQNTHTDRILLEYYIEIFYYYFFSARDVLGQLLNVFYDLKLTEDNIYLNDKFVKKIKSEEIKETLKDFLNNTEDSYNIRNLFNHRFTPTHRDFRAKLNSTKEENRISFYSTKEIEIETFLKDIANLMKQFGYLMNKLIEEIK